MGVRSKPAVWYLDLDFIQPPPAGGLFGLRHFQGFRGWRRNLRMTELEQIATATGADLVALKRGPKHR